MKTLRYPSRVYINNASFVDVFVNSVNQMLIINIKHILRAKKTILNSNKL